VGTTVMTARQPSKEVIARRAIAAATHARRPRTRHQGHRHQGPSHQGRGYQRSSHLGPSNQAGRRAAPPLRTSAGLALTAVGLICALAVHTQDRAFNLQAAGIIVAALGLAWLWSPVRNKGALLRRQFNRAMRYLAWDPGEGSTVRCSLGELLEGSSDEAHDRVAG
jgi:hypothetical protein